MTSGSTMGNGVMNNPRAPQQEGQVTRHGDWLAVAAQRLPAKLMRR